MPLPDGLYKIDFKTPLGAAAGVVTLVAGTVQGGDSTMYYKGTYAQDGNKFTAEVVAKKHSAGASVLGVATAHLTIQGTTAGDTATLNAKAKEAPTVPFTGKLSPLPD